MAVIDGYGTDSVYSPTAIYTVCTSDTTNYLGELIADGCVFQMVECSSAAYGGVMIPVAPLRGLEYVQLLYWEIPEYLVLQPAEEPPAMEFFLTTISIRAPPVQD